FPVAALAEEEIDIGRANHELLRPSRVAGVDDRLAVDRNLHTERRLALLMRDREWLDRHTPDVDVLAADQRLKAERKAERPSGGLFVHRSEEIHRSLFRARRTCDQQLSAPRPLVEVLHDHERETTEMVSVEVAEEDEVDFVGILA